MSGEFYSRAHKLYARARSRLSLSSLSLWMCMQMRVMYGMRPGSAY